MSATVSYPSELIDRQEFQFAEVEFEGQKIKAAFYEINPEYRLTLYAVHGLGTSLNSWLYQFSVLRQLPVRTILVDLPGFGASDKPQSASYSMDSYATFLQAFSESVSKPIHLLMGHSMGGQACLQYAATKPEHLKALLLNAPAGFEKFSAFDRFQLKNFYHPTLYAALAPYYYEFLVRRNFYRWREELRFLITERQSIMHDKDRFIPLLNTMQKCVVSMLATDELQRKMPDVQVPTWVIYGKQDYYIPNAVLPNPNATRRIMERGASLLADSKVIAVNKCGHKVHMDRPDEFNAILKEFVATYTGADHDL